MIEDIKCHVTDWEDEKALTGYLQKILDKQAFDKAGLIYGIGHAVYTLSDPREVLLKEYAYKLAMEKGHLKEYELLDRIENISKKLVAQSRNTLKPICANVDFTADSYIRCLEFLKNFLHQSLQLQELPDGVRIVLKNLSTKAR